MPFMTVRVSSASRGVIYERDCAPEVIFGTFVRLKVSHLVGLGLLKEGDEYWAGITPRFDEPDNLDDLIWEHPGSDTDKPGSGWLVMRTQGLLENEPLKYFTMELHVSRADAFWYRKSFRLDELEDRIKRQKSTLIELGAINKDEEVVVQYLASQHDEMRSREILHMPDELAILGSALQIEAVSDSEFPEKPMPTCSCGHGGEDTGQTLEVFFRIPDFHRLRDYISKHSTRSVESGGILIGSVYRQPSGGQVYIEVEDFIPAEKTAANAVSLRFTHDTWQYLIDRKRERFPENKLVVGWYHTHPPIPITVSGKKIETVRFFSRDDESVQQQFFPKPWQIAVVMDGGSDEFGMFRWQGQTLVPGTLHVFEQDPPVSGQGHRQNA